MSGRKVILILLLLLVIDEAIALTGDNLRVEIFRIEHKRTYKAFTGVGVLIGGIKGAAKKRVPGLTSSIY